MISGNVKSPIVITTAFMLFFACGCGGGGGSVKSVQVSSICGDNIVGSGEQCDDNNAVTEVCQYGEKACAVCDRNCAIVSGVASYCGDGIIDVSNGEECDDENENNEDSCSNGCEELGAIKYINGVDQSCAVSGKLKIELFMMTYEPYGESFLYNTLERIIEDFGAENVEWLPYYILMKTDDGYSAMHGQKEVDESFRQICIREKWGMDIWATYFDCYSGYIYHDTTKIWEDCATESGIDTNELSACVTNDSALLFETDYGKQQKYNSKTSPTSVYDCHRKSTGAIPYSYIKDELCEVFTGEKPESCL